MAFASVGTKTPTEIGDVVVSIRQDAQGSITALYEVQVLDQDGAVLRLERGDLLEVADADSQATLGEELASLRAKAEAELLAQ
ncbi:MAG TPA: hypothetical protein PL105_01890 [Caldilineaceae bacterium]|nr:hypothetical protein [Caldilineaceae bacterium]